jgi:hypothetical protein
VGSATTIFAQRGLIISAVREALEIGEHSLILKPVDRRDAAARFVFADATLSETTGLLNAQAFRRQPWGGTGKSIGTNILEKTTRNRAHIEQNGYSILLVKAAPSGGFVPRDSFAGFTHVIPLNRSGLADYMAGRIEDNLLGPDAIARPGEAAQAMLLFSFALDPVSLRTLYRGARASQRHNCMYVMARELVLAMAFHVAHLMDVHCGVRRVELLAQNDHDSGMLTLFELLKFEDTGKTSRDGQSIRSVVCTRGQP